jgi:hypothetical protein
MVDEFNMSMEHWWKDVERSDRDKCLLEYNIFPVPFQ